MVYNGKFQSKMDDLGVPVFLETPIWEIYRKYWTLDMYGKYI